MITYEFVCDKCNNRIELKLTIEERFSIDFKPPSCCGQPMYQSFDNPRGFELKGRGWSVDGYCGGWDVTEIERQMRKRGEKISSD